MATPNRPQPAAKRRKHPVLCLSLAILSLFVTSARSNATSSDPSFWFRIMVPDNLVPTNIGHASFRIGPDEFLVLAANLAVKQAALQQITRMSGARVLRLPTATILVIPLNAQESLRPVATGQSIHVLLGPATGRSPIEPKATHGEIVFPVSGAGPVVTLAAPGQSGPLLIGTVLGDGALNRHMAGPGYATIPASNGIVIVATSDELGLAADKTGFVLRAARSTPALPIGNPPVSSRRLGVAVPDNGLSLPAGSSLALRHRVEMDQFRIASAPPLDRKNPSLGLARTMLALDLGPEAHGVLNDVVRSDPAAENSKRRRDLLRIADVLSYRPKASAVKIPGSGPASPQPQMWYGLALAERHHMHRAADRLAGNASLLLALPPRIRRNFLPLAVSSLIEAGKLRHAQHLLKRAGSHPELALPRAELLQAEKHPHAAMKAYQALTENPDQRIAGIAAYRLIMLRAQLHLLTPQGAANALVAHVYEWRSVHHEARVRTSIANFQAEAGDWPAALTGLKRAARLLPHEKAHIDAARRKLFDRLIKSGALAGLAPIAAAAIIENNIDLIPPGQAGVSLLKILEARLLALGLPHSTSAILGTIFAAVPPGNIRARLGLDLARLAVRANHLKRAKTVLDQTAAANIKTELADARSSLKAQIVQAAADVAAQSDAPSLLTANPVFAAAHDASEPPIPLAGTLDRKAGRAVIRETVIASRAKKTTALARLRQTYLGRIEDHRQAAIFNTLTAPALPRNAGLSAALERIASIERLGKVIRPTTPQHTPPGPHPATPK